MLGKIKTIYYKGKHLGNYQMTGEDVSHYNTECPVHILNHLFTPELIIGDFHPLE